MASRAYRATASYSASLHRAALRLAHPVTAELTLLPALRTGLWPSRVAR